MISPKDPNVELGGNGDVSSLNHIVVSGGGRHMQTGLPGVICNLNIDVLNIMIGKNKSVIKD